MDRPGWPRPRDGPQEEAAVGAPMAIGGPPAQRPTGVRGSPTAPSQPDGASPTESPILHHGPRGQLLEFCM